MIGYVTVGADDLRRAESFYSAVLLRLGYRLEVSDEGLGYVLDDSQAPSGGTTAFYVKQPFDGRPASVGNGTMVAFAVPSQQSVRALHAAAIEAGGRTEGDPGFRAAYSAEFYVGYLRDPQGNKIALYCDSLSEPARPA